MNIILRIAHQIALVNRYVAKGPHVQSKFMRKAEKMITTDHIFLNTRKRVPFPFTLKYLLYVCLGSRQGIPFACLFVFAPLEGNTNDWAITTRAQERGWEGK